MQLNSHITLTQHTKHFTNIKDETYIFLGNGPSYAENLIFMRVTLIEELTTHI
jgi:hypothetical protein